MCRPPGSATPFTLTPSQIPPTCSSPSAQMEEELTTMGFVDVYTLAEYVCRGSRICLHLSYPYGWTMSYRDPDTEAALAQDLGAGWEGCRCGVRVSGPILRPRAKARPPRPRPPPQTENILQTRSEGPGRFCGNHYFFVDKQAF